MRKRCVAFGILNRLSGAMRQDIFLATCDTIASTVDFAMAELLQHPDTMRKLQEELRSLHRDPGAWPEPDKFMPERFLLRLEETGFVGNAEFWPATCHQDSTRRARLAAAPHRVDAPAGVASAAASTKRDFSWSDYARSCSRSLRQSNPWDHRILLRDPSSSTPRATSVPGPTTTAGLRSSGKPILVTFWAASPPRVFCFTVHRPDHDPMLPVLHGVPKILCSDDDLVPLRVPVRHSPPNDDGIIACAYENEHDYFVYEAGTAENKPPSV
ncbi:hypothetical protein PR202_ga16265 [Eleusine coracana subsp. coracana]|uniref:Cytochrome P450 n=1 Tax=Eleusine coracana subsp. coracana TaxID=191504 RepID=A0AAV5CMS5_ELECO|nr:hypothetical protein PR202_ga16265 [Eleusine coracana subsp. coracana]